MQYLRISFQNWQSCLKEKDTPLEGFEPQSKVRIQVSCDLHLNHQTINLSCSEVGHLLKVTP